MASAEVAALEDRFSKNVIEEANALAELVGLCQAPSPAEEERAFHAVKSSLRCVRSALGENAFYRLACANDDAVRRAHAGSLDERRQAAALELMRWAHTQFGRLGTALALLAGHTEGGLAIPAIQALGEFMAIRFQALSLHQVPCELDQDLIGQAARGLVVDAEGQPRSNVPAEVYEVFVATFGFADSKCAVWASLQRVLEDALKKSAEDRARIAQVVWGLLELFGTPDRKGETFFGQEQDKRGYRKARKAFSGLWGVLLASPMSASLYKSILTRMPDDILPHLSHPVMAVDFCFSAYRHGGICALLSLSSLFIINTRLNVEVPEFYPKLYALLRPEQFVARHRSQLFQLTDMFLSSEYLPLVVAASFAKRLAQLALLAPAPGSLVCLQLVFNLVRRNPNLMCMLHREEEAVAPRRRWRRAEAIDRRNLKQKRERTEDSEGDDVDDYVPVREPAEREPEVPEAPAPILVPEEEDEDAPRTHRVPMVLGSGGVSAGPFVDTFDPLQEDPALTGALESSLWEIEALQKHYWKDVAELAASFAGKFDRPLFDVEKASELGPAAVVDKLRRKKAKNVPLEFRTKAKLLPDELDQAFFG